MMGDAKSEFGAELGRQRKKAGLTFEQLSQHSNLSVTFLKEIESGKKQATITTLLKIAKGLDITPDNLVMPVYEKWQSNKIIVV